MKLKCNASPVFYLDAHPDILNTNRKELIRLINIQADAPDIFKWLNQLRVAPYSYDLIDNRGQKSPHFIIRNLPPLKTNAHFLLAFHIHAFRENSFLVGRFCEPINSPVDSFINGLYIEYRLVTKDNYTQLWCKILGFVKKDISSKMFFLLFSIVNRIMMAKQLGTIKRLSEKLALGEIMEQNYDFRNNYPKSGLHWWMFCRRHNCTGLIT